MREAFVNTLINEAEKDPNIILITGDLGFGVLEKYSENLKNQFINSGINEQTMMGMAAGIASTGKRVFVYSIGNFSTLRCLEQIRNDVCLMNNPVVIVSVGAGYSYGNQGYTHHALEDIAVMRSLPNLDVIVPADPIETAFITKYLAVTNKPAYLRIGKSSELNLHTNEFIFDYGKIFELSSGKDGTLIFSGAVGKIAIEARDLLLKSGYVVAVASMPFVSNIDESYLQSASLKGPIIVVEEHTYRGGVGSAILEKINKLFLDVPIALVASDQRNLSEIGDQNFLRQQNGISAENIVSKYMALLVN
jgi:transketolase